VGLPQVGSSGQLVAQRFDLRRLREVHIERSADTLARARGSHVHEPACGLALFGGDSEVAPCPPHLYGRLGDIRHDLSSRGIEPGTRAAFLGCRDRLPRPTLSAELKALGQLDAPIEIGTTVLDRPAPRTDAQLRILGQEAIRGAPPATRGLNLTPCLG